MGFLVNCIEPYKVKPSAPHMSILVTHDHAECECGIAFNPTRVPKESKVWCSNELASELLSSGHGESLAWNGTRIRWRPSQTDNDDWPVSIMQLPFPESDAEKQLAGLVEWRDWLVSCGASPRASLGSAAWSLLRASLKAPLWTGVGQVPPIRFTLGGRIELGPGGVGEYMGAEHWDFRAAYAHTLGTLQYGGRWYKATRKPDRVMAIRQLERGATGFVRAQITIPSMSSGPLPERPPHSRGSLSGLIPINYPHGTTMQGIWTWQEVQSALTAGCKLGRVLDVYIHLTPDDDRRFPFADWWLRVQDGRQMKGFAGLLAKATGNALWGQFSLVPSGRRQILSYYRSHTGQAKRYIRNVPKPGQRPGAPDLTETITGRVRAKAFQFMTWAGDQLLSVHTDGGWVDTARLDTAPRGMRLKQEAEKIQLLNAQTMRYWPMQKFSTPEEPVAIVSGWPPQLAGETFEKIWEAHHAAIA